MVAEKFPDKLDVKDLYGSDLSLGAKLLWMALAVESDAHGEFRGSAEEVARGYNVPIEVLKELLDSGWLSKEQRLLPGGLTQTVWMLRNPVGEKVPDEIPFDPAPSAVNPRLRVEK